MLLRAVLATVTLLLSSLASAASELSVLRVDGNARIGRADGTRLLAPGMALLSGDTISLAGNGRVALQLAGRGLITLARGAELQVFDSQGGTTPIGRFKLLSGTVRIDSRTGTGNRVQDIRLNVGSLKTRVYGAEAVGTNDGAGDTLCLLAGALEIQTAGAPDSRLDLPGSCLRRSPDGQLSRLRLDSDAPMSAALDATEFSEPAPALADGRQTRPVPIIAPVVAVAAAATPGASSKPGSWTVVVLSLANRAAVDQRTQTLLDQGLPAVSRSAEVKGQTMHRVTIGEFPTQADARVYAKNTLAQAGIEGWLSPL